MNWYDAVFELIDMRSFSNLWYWIAIAAIWSSASHWVLGVPYDMVTRARRQNGQALIDLQDIVRVNVNRILYISGVAGLWLVALSCALLTVLALLGFAYRVEFAQALFLILFPLSFAGLLSIRTAHRIADEKPDSEALFRVLQRHRVGVQLIGMLAIFVTALWGMYKNLDTGPWGF